jgi:hypothetical protein
MVEEGAVASSNDEMLKKQKKKEKKEKKVKSRMQKQKSSFGRIAGWVSIAVQC